MQSAGTKFVFQCSEDAKDMLLEEGIDYKYGARHLKRAVERFLVYPLSNLVATGQIGLGDLVQVGLNKKERKLTFFKKSGGALIQDMISPRAEVEPLASRSGSVGLPIPQAKESKAAKKGQGRGEKIEG